MPTANGDGPPLFVAYDCLLTPAAAYAHRGRLSTRQAALRRIVRRLQALGLHWVRCKPHLDVARNPHAAVQDRLSSEVLRKTHRSDARTEAWPRVACNGPPRGACRVTASCLRMRAAAVVTRHRRACGS